jgi:transcriptional repressor NrdR
MKCPFCKSIDTKVLDTRMLNHGYSIRRRRSCNRCEKRYTTYETIEVSMPAVYKKDGRREEYNRDKLYRGLEKACQKLPIPSGQIERIIEHIEKNLIEHGSKEISAKEIGGMAMEHLKHLHPVAYVRFASVYKDFHDLDEFYKELKDNLAHQKNNRFNTPLNGANEALL